MKRSAINRNLIIQLTAESRIQIQVTHSFSQKLLIFVSHQTAIKHIIFLEVPWFFTPGQTLNLEHSKIRKTAYITFWQTTKDLIINTILPVFRNPHFHSVILSTDLSASFNSSSATKPQQTRSSALIPRHLRYTNSAALIAFEKCTKSRGQQVGIKESATRKPRLVERISARKSGDTKVETKVAGALCEGKRCQKSRGSPFPVGIRPAVCMYKN